jgi:predicted permease
MGWTRFFRRSRHDDELADEIQSYIAIETDANIARGMSPASARAAAQRKFGNATRVREDVYLMNTIGPIDTLWQDLGYAVRLLRRDKTFAIAALLSLTLGIGANTTLFRLLDALRLRTLPVADPASLMEVRIPPGPRSGTFNGRRPNFTYPMWERIRDDQEAFSGVMAWGAQRFNTSPTGEVHFVEGLYVSGGYFDLLGVRPWMGRLIADADDQRGCGASAAVVSHAYWQRELGGDGSVVGRTITLEGHAFPIIGVTPPSFFGMEVGRRYDVAIPLCADTVFRDDGGRFDRRSYWWLAVVGRARPGWTLEQADAHVRGISPGLFAATLPPEYGAEEADGYRSFVLRAEPAATGVSNLRGNFEEPLVILLATSGIILVIACANLANLLLARGTARGREIAVRLALGASRARVVRQLLVESAVLAVTGAVAGVLVASLASQLLVDVLSQGNPSVFVDLGWSWRMLAFTSVVTFVACALFGAFPALRATSLAPTVALKGAGRGTTSGRERLNARRALVATQVALSLVLLLGAFLFTRTLFNLMTAESGFAHDGLVVATVSHLNRVPGGDEQVLRRDLRKQLAALPDVSAIAQADVIPLGSSGFWNENVRVEGAPPPSAPNLSNFNRVSQGFFQTLGIPLVAGRDFDDSDTRQAPPVAIVSEAFVARFVPDGQALGRVVRYEVAPGEPEPAFQIVGVVKDILLQSLRDEIEPMVYVASTQEADASAGTVTQFIFRPRGSASAALPSVVRAVRAFSPDVNVDLRVLDASIRTSLLRERLMAGISAGFGVLAVLLAGIGLYGVMSYTVERRANEIGIRLAMGARGADVLRMVLGDAAWMIGIGLVAGTVLSLALGGFARSLLFQLNPTDPTTVASAVVLVAAIGLVAGLLPARRASRLDPATALRDE